MRLKTSLEELVYWPRFLDKPLEWFLDDLGKYAPYRPLLMQIKEMQTRDKHYQLTHIPWWLPEYDAYRRELFAKLERETNSTGWYCLGVYLWQKSQGSLKRLCLTGEPCHNGKSNGKQK